MALNQQATAGVLAVLVHLAFAVALLFSVSWQRAPVPAVQADLWVALPDWPRARPVESVPVPAATPAPAPPQARPDIELRRQEAARQAAEREREKAAQRAAEERRQHLERLQREFEQSIERQLAADLALERSRRAERLAQATAEAAQQKAVVETRERISSKIRALLLLPPALSGNPEAVFQLRLLPDGEVLEVRLVKPSGQPAYDEAVERAIRKASPLPLPVDRTVAARFRENLQLVFRPGEAH